MKELSIEEKAKAYDEAIEYANYLINERCKEGTDGSFHRADLQKMFPQLEESEDEKIRKELIRAFKSLNTIKVWNGIERTDILTWLEKQGEKKQDVNIQINPSEYINDMGGNGCYLKNTSQAFNKSVETLEKFGKEITKDKETATKFLKSAGIMDENGELAEPYRVCESTSNWNEEDERIYNRICDIVHNAAFTNYDVDEDGKECGEYAKIIGWFKSLKDRYSWKPSELQMECLSAAIEESNENPVLESLYKDLKKLRGGNSYDNNNED